MVIIYVEGDGDKSFFSYFLKHHLPINKEKNYKIETLSGKGKIKKNIKDKSNEFKKQKQKGNDVYILLDSDNAKEKNNYQRDLENLKNENFIDDYFLIEPQLEMFLLNSLSTSAGDDDNNNFLACIAEYERCIQKAIPQNNFKLPPKSKFYAYVEANISQKEIVKKQQKKDFEKKLKWEYFNYNKQYFNELKNFLSKAFSSSDVL